MNDKSIPFCLPPQAIASTHAASPRSSPPSSLSLRVVFASFASCRRGGSTRSRISRALSREKRARARTVISVPHFRHHDYAWKIAIRDRVSRQFFHRRVGYLLSFLFSLSFISLYANKFFLFSFSLIFSKREKTFHSSRSQFWKGFISKEGKEKKRKK